MRILITAMLAASFTLMTGCAGTSAIIQSEYRLAQGEKLKLQLNALPTANAEGMAILRERLTSKLSGSALLASSGDVASRTVDVTVTNYYMRHGATRALVGIMAGSDNMESTVQIKDSSTGKVWSEFKVVSKNPTAWGTSRGMIEEHADKIVETLKSAKR